MQSDYDNNLQSYFTDMEHLRGLFKDYVSAQKLPKRLIVFHGVGGVGKSSLLRMFRLHCKSEKIPVALASGDDTKSVLDVITRWTEDLKEDGIKFPSLSKTLDSYRAIQAKVDDQTKKTQTTGSRMADIASKAASKTAETAGGALLGAAIGSIVPGVGTAIGGAIGGVVSGMSADALTDWLRGFLTKPDIDLLLDPAKRFTTDFLVDIARVAEKKRIAMLLDTFEQMSSLEDWVGEVAQKVHPNVLMVIAGRKLPDWNRLWSGWMMNAQVEELKPMTEDIMRELIHRYYATMRGGEPDPVQEGAIIRFARGLPMVVTSAVQLWVKYGVEDFQSVKAEIVANLVDRLMEGVPSALIPALEAAAVVRWFDQPILRAVMKQEDVRDIYNELRRFPFVRTRAEGLALHDSVREIMDENLLVQDSERHYELHDRAALYFEKRLEKTLSEEAERLELERLYHRISSFEEKGIKLFQELAEQLTQHQFVGRLRILMKDVNTYQLHIPNSRLWRDYYNARLLHISARFLEAEEIYTKISEDEQAEIKLRAYALCDGSQIWTRNFRLMEPGGLERAFLAIERSQKLVPELDSKLALNFLHLRYAYMFKGELDKAIDALIQQYGFYKRIGDKSGIVYSLDMLKDLYGILGNWQMAADAEREGLMILGSMSPNQFLQTRLIGHNIWHKLWSGRLAESESGIKQALTFAEQEDYIEAFPGLYRDLGLVLGLQRQWKLSHEYFTKSVATYNEWISNERSSGLGTTLGFWGLIFLRQREFLNAEKYLTDSLSIKREIQDNSGIPETLVWMGEMYEMKMKETQGNKRSDYLAQAESCYQQCLDYRWTSRQYFECVALTGLMRIKYTQKEYSEIANIFTSAEQIAEEYRYHDLLASLHLFKGHVQWSGLVKAWSSGFDATLISYKLALLHALSYNRFLLDEVLWGERASTPLVDIISMCQSQGSNGRKILEVLANLWGSNVEEFMPSLSDNIFLSEMRGNSLSQAEAKTRKFEPGDGTPQANVIEKLRHSLS
jgi:tetratricopeptide (TPR) repeat protein